MVTWWPRALKVIKLCHFVQNGQRIDECALPTTNSCSCVPSWVSNGKTYTGCSEINSPGKPWCKVREKTCGSVNGSPLSPCLLQ